MTKADAPISTPPPEFTIDQQTDPKNTLVKIKNTYLSLVRICSVDLEIK